MRTGHPKVVTEAPQIAMLFPYKEKAGNTTHDRKNVPGIRSPPTIEIHASRQTGRNQKAFSTVSPHSSSTLMSNPQGLSVEKKLPL